MHGRGGLVSPKSLVVKCLTSVRKEVACVRRGVFSVRRGVACVRRGVVWDA